MKPTTQLANVNKIHDEQLTLGQRVADKVAAGMGSWPFIVIQSIILVTWIVINTVKGIDHYDPYPYILLNLALSFQAAYAAPFIMISQNRQTEKDRLKSDQDYLIDMKAEDEVREMLSNMTKLLELIDAQEKRELLLLEKLDLLISRSQEGDPHGKSQDDRQ